MGIPQPAFYIFKCEQSSPPGMPKPSCVSPQTQDLFQHLAQKLMKEGIMGTVQPIRTSCLSRCLAGPVMLVEPGHFMYAALTKEKIDRIIEEHLIGGNVVKEYLISEEMWGDAISPCDMKKTDGNVKMTIEMLYSKIHRATVTDANLNYVGSITVDEELLEASKMRVGQKVEILNINNGERFSTYIILGERGKRDICLNGAARKVHKGDKIIIVAYATYDESELAAYKPRVVLVNEDNDIEEILEEI